METVLMAAIVLVVTAVAILRNVSAPQRQPVRVPVAIRSETGRNISHR